MLIQLFLIGGGLATYLHQRNKRNTKKTVSQNFSGKKLLQDFKTAVLGDERQQQQLTLDPEMQTSIKKYEKEANRNLVLSVGATGLALLASVYPMLGLLGAGAVLYLARDVMYSILYGGISKKAIF
jgi:biopolymer transport protein ExbB/TolQ